MYHRITLVVVLQVATCLIVLAGIVVGFYWGRFAAVQALESQAGRGKAYMTALLPLAAFSVGLYLNSAVAAMAGQAFWTLGAAATIGACFRYHQKES